MKAVIDYWFKTEVSEDQTEILFKDEWHKIICGSYFIYNGNEIHFQVVEDSFNGWSEDELNEVAAKKD